MGRAEVLITWTCCIVLVLSLSNELVLVQGIGVNWGSQASHNLHPKIVADLLKDNGINKVKLFDSDPWTVSFFAGTGIEVMIGIPNNQLKRFSKDFDNCKDWVKENVTRHLYNGGVDIKYVAVGNEPFLKAYNGSFMDSTFPAIQNIQRALNEAGLGDKIKATTPLNADVYDTSSGLPSGGAFRPDIEDLMVQMVRYFSANNAPFLVNIYPFLSLYQNSDFPTDFAFFDGNVAKPVIDKGITYTNVFDANFDTLVWSLRKAGVPDLEIVIGEIGWPTDGDKNANAKLAKRFYDGFLKKMAEKKGTPMRPHHIDAYLFSLTDENRKSIDPGNFERHWGIFRYDGQPKFPMDFAGKGFDKMPKPAKGVVYLPSQWCVLNKDIKNLSRVGDEVGYACAQSDCTSLGFGCSCNDLDPDDNISYAFNMYFQMNDQDVEACNFNGLAKIVKHNESHGNCVFPVQIESAAKALQVVVGTSIMSGLFIFLALF